MPFVRNAHLAAKAFVEETEFVVKLEAVIPIEAEMGGIAGNLEERAL